LLTAGRGWLAVGAKVAAVGAEVGATVGAAETPGAGGEAGVDVGRGLGGGIDGAGGKAGAGTAAVATALTAISDSTPSTLIFFTPASLRKEVALPGSASSSSSSSSSFSQEDSLSFNHSLEMMSPPTVTAEPLPPPVVFSCLRLR